MNRLTTVLCIIATLASGCSGESEEKIQKNTAENADDKAILALRESETLVAFSNIQFGDSEGVVVEKLNATPNIRKGYGYIYGLGENSLRMEFEYRKGGLYKVLFSGSIDNLNPLEQALVEKYKLSNDPGSWGEFELAIPGDNKYNVSYIEHHIGSRKLVKFQHFDFYYKSDRENFQKRPRSSEIEIYDAQVQAEIESDKLKVDEINKNKQMNDARKIF